ncbi:MAG: monovalent cation/H+ antiporter subunit D [Gammaproteobacteria bacterium]|nr:monovalent cation/H+ antiporter subunit D [Gammaproteobacteria bacterium]
MSHLIIAPVILPLVAGAIILLLYRRPGAGLAINLAATMALFGISIALLGGAASGAYGVYALGDWPAPYGIVLVQDRLSALMVALTAALALSALLYATSGALRRDGHFHALFQFQLFGLNGAFLTGDLFNLFVFFEVLLIASYGLLLCGEGGGRDRTRAALHYVVLNLAGSAVFLVALGIIYSVTGTLNMADLAVKVANVRSEDAGLLGSGSLLLLVVFALKAALLPLHFWLPAAYSHAAAPVAALFAVMTKVGVYAILRVYTLIFGTTSVAGAALDWLLPLAILTIVLAGLGALAATSLRRLVSYLVILSVGTLLAGVSLFNAAGLAAALYYLLHTTLVTGALYLVADLIARSRGGVGDDLASGPAPARASLGMLFMLGAVAIAGLPPLSGFLGKLLVLEAAIGHAGMAWLWAGLLGSSLLAIIALSRAGSSLFWHTSGESKIRVRPAALVYAALPLAASPLLVVFAEPVSDYASATAAQLLAPEGYILAVLGSSLGAIAP